MFTQRTADTLRANAQHFAPNIAPPHLKALTARARRGRTVRQPMSASRRGVFVTIGARRLDSPWWVRPSTRSAARLDVPLGLRELLMSSAFRAGLDAAGQTTFVHRRYSLRGIARAQYLYSSTGIAADECCRSILSGGVIANHTRRSARRRNCDPDTDSCPGP